MLLASRTLRAAAIVLVLAFGTVTAYRAIAETMIAGVSLASLDRTCKPCDDFYQFADGGWLKTHTIQPQYSSRGIFEDLDLQNRKVVQAILEQAAKAHVPFGSNEQKIGDFYASCMDLTHIERSGLLPLEDQLRLIDTLNSTDDLAPTLAKLQLAGANVFFNFSSSPDVKDSSVTIADLDQGGLGLPDRDYYTREDQKSATLRDQYVKHIATLFALDGQNPVAAAANAQTVL